MVDEAPITKAVMGKDTVAVQRFCDDVAEVEARFGKEAGDHLRELAGKAIARDLLRRVCPWAHPEAIQ